MARKLLERKLDHSYERDPAGYAREVLGQVWWSMQQRVAELLLTPPYKVLVKASHKVGKTHLAGGLVNWWYDTFNPGLVLTTAPTDTSVRDLLWKEVRVQRGSRGGFRGPKMPRLESSADHWAHGFTARDGEAFQGRHSQHGLIVFDEAVGVAPVFWETAKTMFAGEGWAWLAIFNPTDTSSQAYIEENTGNWHVVTMSALEHPNIAAELAGEPPPFPAAIRLGRLNEWLEEWCQPVVGEPVATDVEWPPRSGKFLRPGPIAEARVLGRWPTAGTYGVWSDGLWQAVLRPFTDADMDGQPVEIGCDVARFGDDYTAIHVRRGNVSLHHESVNGWSTAATAGRIKQLCNQYAELSRCEPQKIAVKIDDDGVGGGVVDQADGYCFIGLSAATRAANPNDYPNRRSELWFQVASRARTGQLSFAKLPAEVLNRLKQQAMAPTWKLDSSGRRVVEPKDETKKKITRSPDDMDAVNLAYSPLEYVSAKDQPERKPRKLQPTEESAATRRGLYGRT